MVQNTSAASPNASDPLALTRAAIVRPLTLEEASAGMALGDELLGELPTTVNAPLIENVRTPACQEACNPSSSGATK